MYAETFDDFKRKLARKPDFQFEAVPVETCIIHTPLWETWYSAFNAESSDLHVTIEPDGSTYTFYRLVAKKATEKN
jgi:hypothetical protein